LTYPEDKKIKDEHCQQRKQNASEEIEVDHVVHADYFFEGAAVDFYEAAV